jgi:hypothetical protein
MRLRLAASLAAAAAGLAAIALPAQAADVAVPLNATPLPRLVQGDDGGGGYHGYRGYRPACPERYYFSCRYDPAGAPHCACWPGFGFFGYY